MCCMLSTFHVSSWSLPNIRVIHPSSSLNSSLGRAGGSIPKDISFLMWIHRWPEMQKAFRDVIIECETHWQDPPNNGWSSVTMTHASAMNLCLAMMCISGASVSYHYNVSTATTKQQKDKSDKDAPIGRLYSSQYHKIDKIYLTG